MLVVIYDLRPLRTILAECRDLRAQARRHPSCAWIAVMRLGTLRHTLAAIRSNRAELRRTAPGGPHAA